MDREEPFELSRLRDVRIALSLDHLVRQFSTRDAVLS